MTPKEKAKDLIEKFYPCVQWKMGQEDCMDRAKECALIAVDLVLSSCVSCIIYYWQEVKQEIEKL